LSILPLRSSSQIITCNLLISWTLSIKHSGRRPRLLWS
jgi:hypothetical protein